MENEADFGIDYRGIGRRIKAARKKKGLSQKSLAMLADIAATNLSHIERGGDKAEPADAGQDREFAWGIDG